MGQNLIPNYSFEDTMPQTRVPYFGPSVSEWTIANQGSPDYFSPYNQLIGLPGGFFSRGVPLNFFGHQYPKTGIAYMGLALNGYFNPTPTILREYLQARLKKALLKDSTYCLQFYISLADSCQIASRNLFGIYFTTTKINTTTPSVLNFTPQIIASPTTYITDKVNWLEYNFQYTAQGGERFMVMGNFQPYGFVDSLSLTNGGTQFCRYYSITKWRCGV